MYTHTPCPHQNTTCTSYDREIVDYNTEIQYVWTLSMELSIHTNMHTGEKMQGLVFRCLEMLTSYFP